MPDSLILKEKAEQPQPFPLFFGKIAKSLLKFVTLQLFWSFSALKVYEEVLVKSVIILAPF